jgi:hypothetical protein
MEDAWFGSSRWLEKVNIYKRYNGVGDLRKQSVDPNGGDKRSQCHDSQHDSHAPKSPPIYPDNAEENVALFPRKYIHVLTLVSDWCTYQCCQPYRPGPRPEILRVIVIAQRRKLVKLEVGDSVSEENDGIQEEVEYE